MLCAQSFFHILNQVFSSSPIRCRSMWRQSSNILINLQDLVVVATPKAFGRVFNQNAWFLGRWSAHAWMQLLLARCDAWCCCDIALLRLYVDTGFDLVNWLLCLFNHLYRFVPFLLKSNFSFLDIQFFNIDPSINLLLLCMVSPWRTLIILEQLLNVLLFFLFTQSETVFPELDQLLVFTVLHVGVLLVVCEFLERVTVEDTSRGLAYGVVVT